MSQKDVFTGVYGELAELISFARENRFMLCVGYLDRPVDNSHFYVVHIGMPNGNILHWLKPLKHWDDLMLRDMDNMPLAQVVAYKVFI